MTLLLIMLINGMLVSRNSTGVVVAALLFSTSFLLVAENWPSWRGPSYNGSRAGENYPTQWGVDKVAWKIELSGKGASSPIVWKDRIFLTAPAEGVDTALAFDLDGKEIWKTEFGAETKARHMKLGTSSNASPVTDGKGVFVYFKSGTFAALEMDGRILMMPPVTMVRMVILTRMG
ncbi:PQQ-like beta-propeller repeat protein [Akkermansiaceae bacterium]|nr:PQQ-like beta-propeller repeat protein [Akkermansiaceae bacterium]